MLTVADVETLIGAALAVERQAVIPVIAKRSTNYSTPSASATSPSWLARRADWQSPSLRPAAGALELALATKRGKVLDLPNPLKSVN